MDDYRKINILEDIEKLSKEIQLLLIEQIKSNKGYQEKINRLYLRLDKLNIELKRIIPPSNDKDDS